MKKIISLLLVLATMLTLSACGSTTSTSPGEEVKKANYGVYIKDSEVFFTDTKNDAWQISSRLVDDEDLKDEELAIYGSILGYYTNASSDGSIIFFPDKFNGSDDGVNLYYRKTDNTEAEAIKIDSDVTVYTVNASATMVTYTKGTGEDCNLYQYSIKDDDKEKIASAVKSYVVSKDGSKILYITTDGTLFAKVSGEDKVKIASDITSLVNHSGDFTTVYYIKDEALYKQPVSGDREKIDSDIYKIIQAYESGEVYYAKRTTEEDLSLMDYVVDDMKAVDDNAPTEYPSKPRSYNYDTTEEYEKAYAEYEEAYEAYYAKANRDEWRTSLAGKKLSDTTYSLCFYNGTEVTVITDTFSGFYSYTAGAEKPVISYVAYDQENLEKETLSAVIESNDISKFKEKVESALFSAYDRYITIGATATVMKQENATGIRINESGTEIYYVDDIPDGKDAGDLYKISVVENVVGTPELYDSEVYAKIGYFLSDTQFLYFKDYKDGTGDLYLNKAKVDYDVSSNNLNYNENTNKLYYLIDWDNDKSYGVLKEYSNGESVKISDDVYSYAYVPDGKVLYLYDYSLKYYAGELHLWENGESTKIDDDVIFLVPNFSNGELIQKMIIGTNYYSVPATEAPAASSW